MTRPDTGTRTLHVLDDATRTLVRLAAVVATKDEGAVREMLGTAYTNVPPAWVEELLLQTYLFAGFPRALNAMREWRRLQRVPATSVDDAVEEAREAGESTCAAVYGPMYARLRGNIQQLHPLLDDWMIEEGYGKVLSRDGLDLVRRELCIVAACAASNQDRQLHSHLHGALNVGASPTVVGEVIEAVAELLEPERAQSVRLLWARVRGK